MNLLRWRAALDPQTVEGTMLSEVNEKPGVEETYGTTTASSNLRVGIDPDIRTPGDIIAAAGMNTHRMGLALMRLRTEWDTSAKPLPPVQATIEQIAASFSRVPAGQANAGLVREVVGGEERFRLPMVVAQETAAAWYHGELTGFLGQLRSLPNVREALAFWAAEQGYEEGVHLVTAVLLWWLHPACAVCAGTGKLVVPGTGGRSSKACKECRKHQVPGQRKVPHGHAGRRLLAFINECGRAARVDLQQRLRQRRSS
jgi:hypothetical protein